MNVDVASGSFAASGFSAPVEAWLQGRFAGPTDAQVEGWPVIARGDDVLIAAPTGSGKTLTAFTNVLDQLTRRAQEGDLPAAVEVVYVSPLRALSHDIDRNLEEPLAGIRAAAVELGVAPPAIRTGVRTGDTPQRDRQAMLRHPPHVLVTTPESLFILLTTGRGKTLLAGVRTVIVDEIHALARDKRGSHFALTLERLEAHVVAEGNERPQRIGLSATQRPMDKLARFLVGAHADRPPATIVDLGHQRDLDLLVEVPTGEELCAVASHEQWDEILDLVAERIKKHRTTLVFVNQRRLSERVAHRLAERLGSDRVAAHHGSLSRERRLAVESRLKDGALDALVATASLELGIDIGHVDLVCQMGSPRGIATFLQRVGRSGHALGLVPKGRLYPTTRDELMECAAVARAVKAGRLDRITPPIAPLDILAQQIVAATADTSWLEDDLYALMTSASPYADLSRRDFDRIVAMLAEGFETPRGKRAVHVHRDRIQGLVRGRRGARLAAIMSGGAIPDLGDYQVVLDPEETVVGSVNEDWAVEASAGDIFLLGTHSWRIRRIENGKVRVVDAEGAPPTIPFWLGEAPGRTDELSEEVSSLRADLDAAIDDGDEGIEDRFKEDCVLSPLAAEQVVHYVRVQKESTGVVPTRERIVAERFFDESGGMQLVVHAPYGSRVNRGFGLALRKRFCRAFNMELQAAATDDAIVLSLGNPQTFDLETLPKFLASKTVADVLTQAMLGSPLFQARWRWNATRSLAVLRARGGRRLPFNIQRMESDDLLAAAFPDQAACQEHVVYPLDVPDHPLVAQTIYDCLHEAADIGGLERLIAAIESGAVEMKVIDTVEPSPFAHEILGARPFAFLDDAPLEERKTRAVAMRRYLPERGDDLAKLDDAAISRVREEVEPDVRDQEELHELLLDAVLVRVSRRTEDDTWCVVARHHDVIAHLVDAGRATFFIGDRDRWLVATERLREAEVLLPDARAEPVVRPPAELDPGAITLDAALDAAVRGHAAFSGPVAFRPLAEELGRSEAEVDASTIRLETRGVGLRGRFDPAIEAPQFCDRRLLARIDRYTLETLRRQIEPVSPQSYLRFLLRWQHLHPESRVAGEGGLMEAIERLAAWEAPVVAWEAELLPRRMDGYRKSLLDALCLGGRVAWGRLQAAASSTPSRATPIALWPRGEADDLLAALDGQPGEDDAPGDAALRGPAAQILEVLRQRGALFPDEIRTGAHLLPAQLEEGLRELVAAGRVTADGFAPLRHLVRPPRSQHQGRRATSRKITANPWQQPSGRINLLRANGPKPDAHDAAEACALRLLKRYGVVFRDLVARELLPMRWRDIRRALNRLEARGLVRGGRFVAGFVGEHFALPEAIPRLRKERDRPLSGEEIEVSAVDPVNLAGIVTPGPRVPARHTLRLVFHDGVPTEIVENGVRRPISEVEQPPDEALPAGTDAVSEAGDVDGAPGQ